MQILSISLMAIIVIIIQVTLMRITIIAPGIMCPLTTMTLIIRRPIILWIITRLTIQLMCHMRQSITTVAGALFILSGISSQSYLRPYWSGIFWGWGLCAAFDLGPLALSIKEDYWLSSF